MNRKAWLAAPLLFALAACTAGSATQTTLTAQLATRTETGESSQILPDEAATAYMYDLSTRDRGAAALEAVLEAQDERFISVLIEVMRGSEIGIVQGTDYQSTIAALETLSGESYGADWPAWIEWYGTTELSPPPGFTGWKGEMLS